MPVVPTSKQTVTLNPIASQKQSSRGATADAFGAGLARAQEGVGRAVQGIGNQIADEGIKLQIEHNERETKRRDSEYAKEVDRILYGDPDNAEIGFYGLNGQDNLDAVKSTQEKLAKARAKHMEGANDAVKRTLQAAFDQRDNQTRKGVLRKWEQERVRANNDASEGRNAVAILDASRDPTDVELLENSMDTVESEAAAIAERQGLSGDALTAKVTEARTTLLNAVFTSAMKNEDYVSATRVLKDNVELMNPLIAADMADKLREQGGIALAQAAVQEAIALFPDDQEAQKKYIDGLANGKVKSRAYAALREQFEFAARFDRTKKQQEEDKDKLLARAQRDQRFKWAEKEKLKKDAKAKAEDILVDAANAGKPLDEDLMSKVDFGLQERLRKKQIDVASGVPQAATPESFQIYEDLTRMGKEDLAKQSLANLYTKLPEREYKVVEKMIRDARDTSKPTPSSFTANQIFNSVADSLKLIGSGKKQKRQQLNTLFHEAVTQQEEELKRKLKPSEIRTTLDELVTEVAIRDTKFGFSFNSTGNRVFEIQEKMDDEERVQAIAKIRLRLNNPTYSPTGKEILEQFIIDNPPVKD